MNTSTQDSLTRMQRSITDDNVFVPMVAHHTMPTPMPVAGKASDTLEDAVIRVEEMLMSPNFVKGWVVSKDSVTAVGA